MAFGQDIRKLRLESKLSVRELAERLGVDAGRLRQWELKDFDPRFEDRLVIESALNCKLAEVKNLTKLPEQLLIIDPKGIPGNVKQPTSNLITRIGNNYQRGQRFEKIINEIIKKGNATLESLRDEIFKVKGSALSKMYFGIIPVNESIKSVLEEKYNVNLLFLDNPNVPLFLEHARNEKTSSADSTAFIRFYSLTISKDKKKSSILVNAAEDIFDIKKLFAGSQFVVKMTDGSMYPTYPNGAILGLREVPIQSIIQGKTYLVEIEKDYFIRRLFYSNTDKQQSSIIECVSDNTEEIKSGTMKGKPLYPPFTIPSNKIKRIFKIISVYQSLESLPE